MRFARRLLLVPFLAATAFADGLGDAKTAAQTFYDGYMAALRTEKEGAAQKCVLESDHVSAAFKKAYRTYMKAPDADPIIDAQDFPKTGFKVTDVALKGNSALVTLGSRDPAFRHAFKATFQLTDGKWLLAGTAALKPK